MGGVETSTLSLARQLNRGRWQPFILSPQEGDLPRLCREAGLPVHVLPTGKIYPTSLRLSGPLSGQVDRRLPNPLAWLWNALTLWSAGRRTAGFLQKSGADLLVTKGFPAHYTGGLAARRAGIPCLWHLQDQVSERFGGIYRRFFAWTAARLPDFIVADGSPILDQLPAWLHGRSRVVLNGVDTDEFKPSFQPGLQDRAVREQYGIPQPALVVGHAARLTPWKGQHHLLEAFTSLAGRFPQAHLMLVGSALFEKDDFAKSLQQRAAASGFHQRIHFTGYRHDLAEVLSGMDLFVYPSVEKDTSPLALLSAMACGLPVIAFDIPGVNEVVGQAGLLVRNRDEKALAAEMTRMLEDPALRRHYGQASRQAALERFSLEAHTRQMEEAFHQAINRFEERRPDHRFHR
jgi:hypothetical protein